MQYSRADLMGFLDGSFVTQVGWTFKATGSALDMQNIFVAWTSSRPVTNQPSRKPRQSVRECNIIWYTTSAETF